MPRLNKAHVELNSLENGISEQAAVARDKSQAEAQVNLISDIARGVVTRPGTVNVSKISNEVYSDNEIKIFHIDRDKTERYKVSYVDGDIAVHDLQTGEAKNINYPDGKAYLASSNPGEDFRMITVADTSWVLNRSVVAKMSNEYSAEQRNEAIIYIKRGMRGHSYMVRAGNYKLTVYAAGTKAGYPSECSSEDIASTIVNGYDKSDGTHVEGLLERGFLVSQKGSVVRIRYKDNSDFEFEVSDSYGNQGMVGVKGTVDDFADLPAECWDGTKIKVTGKDSTGLDDYYVEYRSTSGTEDSNGVWVESSGWNLLNDIDPSTMPHNLIREADGSFSFRQIEWTPRKVGDETTAPAPGFIDSKICDVFFHLNRLVLASRDKVIFSRDDKYGCFFPRKATEVLADDYFELATTGNNIADISFVTSFGKSLIVMCENKQFILTSDTALTPEEAKITESTTYKSSTIAAPTLAGSNMFFVSPNGDYSIVREYFLSEDTVTYQAADITKHIPEYIPKGITQIDAHNNDDLLICRTPEEPNRLYVYKYLWINNEKAQSSWSYFELSGKVLHFCYLDNSIYLVMQYSDGVYLEKMTLFSKELDEGMIFEPCLDRRVSLQGAYDSESDTTSFTTPYVIDDISDYAVVLGGGFTGLTGLRVDSIAKTSETSFSIAGDYSKAAVYFGAIYDWEYKLSTQYVRNESQPGAPAYTAERTQLISLSVIYKNSGNFDVEVKNRDQIYKYEKTGRIGARELRVGQQIIDTGILTVPVRAENVNAEISVKSSRTSSYAPVSLQKIEWDGYYASR